VPTLVLVAGGLAAVETGGRPLTATPPGGATEVTAGRPRIVSGRTVTVLGMLDLDAVQRGNYTDGNDDLSDTEGFGLSRAEIGFRVGLREELLAQFNIGYRTRAGGEPVNNPPDPPPGTPLNDGRATLQRAQVTMYSFAGFQSLSLDAGRMPVHWETMRNGQSFLLDSRGDDHDLTGWDGISLGYNGFTEIQLRASAYKLPDLSGLYGIFADWEPARAGAGRPFVTVGYFIQQDIPLVNGTRGSELQNILAGLEYDLDATKLWIEGAVQRGTVDDDSDFSGWGASTGLRWDGNVPRPVSAGVRFDWLSGQKQGDSDITAFVNPWESVSDTYIVESEKYGELSRYLQGNLQAVKLNFGGGFTPQGDLRADFVYGYYRLDEPAANGSDSFGQEFDLTLTWKYDGENAVIKLFGGGFWPGSSFPSVIEAVAPPAEGPAATDLIWLFGANLLVQF
jgi:hypothetical protein